LKTLKEAQSSGCIGDPGGGWTKLMDADYATNNDKYPQSVNINHCNPLGVLCVGTLGIGN